MGIFKIIVFGFGFLGTSLFMSLRLGKKLEISCRQTGRYMGMFYRYTKISLNNLKPKSHEPGEIVRMVRAINQQSHAFAREFQENLLKNKNELSNLVPSINSNYLEERAKEAEKKLNDLMFKEKENVSSAEMLNNIKNYNEDNNITGVDLFEQGIYERRSIVTKKRRLYAEKRNLF